MPAIDLRIKEKIATSKQKMRTRCGFLAAARPAEPAQEIAKKEIVFVIILGTNVAQYGTVAEKEHGNSQPFRELLRNGIAAMAAVASAS